MRYLVCYDIPDDRRRNRLAETLLNYGQRVQESVFECLLGPPLAAELREKLSHAILPLEDKLLLLPICANCDATIIRLGLQTEAADPEYYIL